MKIWIDGSGWNGRESKWIVVFEDGTIRRGSIPEERTNNQMEYEALINALKLADPGDEILTDSQLLVGHLKRGWRVKTQHLLPLFLKAKKLIEEKNIKLTWVPRRENLAGNLLESYEKV
ncbi:MAG: hypothetical protein DRP12_00250 [Candidatus Aenigmatarchaeota archaeon]|nr:MAG: hypothetical protein DRP12_00250 [Candidatus Aenigmarchaeota archaeon]